MATNDLLIKEATPVILGVSGSHAPAAKNDYGTPGVALDLTSVADSAYRQSAKVDLGAAFKVGYEVVGILEFAATPTAGEVCYLYWCPSKSGTAANANLCNTTGSDSAYTGYSSNADDAIKQANLIGTFICTAQATGTVQVGKFGYLFPHTRYGNVVFRNESGASMHSDMVEMSIAFLPIIPHPEA